MALTYSDELQALNNLFDLLGEAQSVNQGVMAQSGNSLIDLIKEAISNIFTPILDAIGGKVTDIKDKVMGNLNGKISDVGDWLNDKTTIIKDWVKDKVGAVEGWVNSSAIGIKSWITTKIDTVEGWIDGAVTSIEGKIDNIQDGISGALETVIGWVVDKLDGIVSSITNTLTGAINNLKDKFSEFAGNIKQAIIDAVEGAYDWIAGIVLEARDWVNNTIEAVKAKLTETYEGVKTWIGNTITAAKENIEAVVGFLRETYETAKSYIQDKIEALVTKIKDVWEKLGDWFEGIKQSFLSWYNQDFMGWWNDTSSNIKESYNRVKTLYDDFLSGKITDIQDFADRLDTLFGGGSFFSDLITLFYQAYRMMQVWQIQFIPMQVEAQKRAIINLQMEPISTGEAAIAFYKGSINKATFDENARLSGIRPGLANASLEANRPLPTPGAIQEAFLRGEITEKEHDKYLSSYGYKQDDIDLFKSLYWIIPTPTDLIRMAVREVFSPEIAERFGQYEDYPKVFTDWASKIGLSADWARNYWAAHWDLPSPQMGFEMLHRGVIDSEELQLLLRALDVMPYWRERLIQISYSPLTRVDVRRMYKLGLLTDEQVTRAYLDLGYDPEKAGWLTEFTKRYSAPEDVSELDEFRAMARTTYSQSYKRNIISRDEYKEFLLNMKYHPDDVELLVTLDDSAKMQAEKLFDLTDYRKDYQKLIIQAYQRGLNDANTTQEMLVDLGYEDNEAILEITLLDYNQQLTIRNLLVEKLHEQYTGYIITQEQLYQLFAMFDFSPNEQEKLLETWNIERSFRSKQPSMSDLTKFYKSGLLTLSEYLDEIRGLGYHEKYIDMYAQMITMA